MLFKAFILVRREQQRCIDPAWPLHFEVPSVTSVRTEHCVLGTGLGKGLQCSKEFPRVLYPGSNRATQLSQLIVTSLSTSLAGVGTMLPWFFEHKNVYVLCLIVSPHI